MPGHHDYIPRPDGDFAAWASHFDTAVHDFWIAHGLNPTDLKPFEDALFLWNQDYPAHIAAQAAAEAAAAQKREARYGVNGVSPGTEGGLGGVEAEARRLAAFIQGMLATTDADRANLGITVRDAAARRVPVPTTRPLAWVQSGQRLTHLVRFADESTPTRRARPGGAAGAEVWCALTPPMGPLPTSDDAYRFLAVSSRGTLRTTFTSADAGKTAHYALRWVSTRGERGPWSDVATATVAA